MERYTEIINEVQDKLGDANKSHDWDHTLRVYHLCMHIGEIEQADMEILKLASILHDISRNEEDRSKGRVCHAEMGAKAAREILKRHQLQESVIEQVAECIRTHRFKGNAIPQSKEAKILFDADKLDSIGAIGLARAFVFAGEVGAKVHNKDIDVEKTRPYSQEDTAYREYLVKLRKIKDIMMTAEGKRMAESRHDFMVSFFDRINKEVDGEI